MARVDLPKGIVAIHGKIGNLIYRSRKQPDGTYRVFVHEAPGASSRRNGKSGLRLEGLHPSIISPSSVQHRSNIGPISGDKQS